MKLEILVFDEIEEESLKLISEITQLMKTEFSDIIYKVYKPKDVFELSINHEAQIIFFTVTSMYDLEAARRLYAFHRKSFLVIISNTDEYSTWSWSLGADYYLVKPIDRDELLKTLRKSEVVKAMKVVEL